MYYTSMIDKVQDYMATPALVITTIAIAVIQIVAVWRMFEKAGIAGWKAIIPFYNAYLLFKMGWGRGWIFFIAIACCFVPFVGGIAAEVLLIINYVYLSQAFGHGAGYAVGLIFLPTIFTLILGFDSSEYNHPHIVD